MRVLYATRSWSTHDQLFLDAWQDSGADIIAVTANGSRGVGSGSGDLATSHLTFGERVRQAVEGFHPDVVHAGPLVDIATTVCEVWSGPLIAMSWGFDLLDEIVGSSARSDRVRVVLKRANQVIVDNNAPQRVALELGADPSLVRQFPWGVDLALFTPGLSRLRQSIGWPENDLVILCTRRHESYYDVQTIVRAFIGAAIAAPRLRLVLAGNGSETDRLGAMLRDAGLENRVRFLGEVKHADLPDVYRAADLYVSASRVDGSSVSLLEAMACGIPTCVSNIEGNAQWIAGGRGITFAVGADAELAACFERFACEAEGADSAWHDAARLALDYVRHHGDWSSIRRLLPVIGAAAIEDFRKRA